jgi:glycosyltransferase involved in cell wall biosynthesis
MQNNPLVSIIMNCYNSDEFLKEAIESVLNQTYSNFEIIFWDNQSTDNSAKIVKSYDDNRIKYFYASNFTPLGEARNLAIDKCIGEWIAFLDCDDIWDKNKLQISFLELKNSKENISLIYSKTEIINKDGNITGKIEKSISGNIHNQLLNRDNDAH